MGLLAPLMFGLQRTMVASNIGEYLNSKDQIIKAHRYA